MKSLIGKTIKRIFVGEIYDGRYLPFNSEVGEASFIKDGGYLLFETNYGDVVFYAEGDCCSESYISDINRVKNILGQKVIDVKEIDLPEEEIPPHQTRQEEDEVYGFHIITEKGIGLIIMRNSSNGYYGGELVEINTKLDKSKLIEVNSDFNSKDYFET